jgi:hypothetical protein
VADDEVVGLGAKGQRDERDDEAEQEASGEAHGESEHRGAQTRARQCGIVDVRVGLSAASDGDVNLTRGGDF